MGFHLHRHGRGGRIGSGIIISSQRCSFQVPELEGAMRTLGELKVKISLLIERDRIAIAGRPNHVPYGS